MSPRGRHLLVELRGCSPSELSDLVGVRTALLDAAAAAGATVVAESLHRFAEDGVTGVVLLAESHISIHTWPEVRYAAVDVYTCGSCEPEHAVNVLADRFSAERVFVLTVDRGVDGTVVHP